MKIKFTLLALAIALTPFIGKVQAASDSLRFELLTPVVRQSVQPGETLQIKWKASNFEPTSTHGINVFLTERTFKKRVRIAFISEPSPNGIYTVDWQIPSDFFSRKRLDESPTYFRIDIKAHTGTEWVKARSLKSLYLIEPSGMTTPKETINNVVKTEVEVMETPVSIPEGSQFVAKYEFKSTLEPWIVRRLTAVNDTEDDGFDPDSNEITNVIEKVYVRYPNEAGTIVNAEATMVNGKATFSNLDFYVPKRDSSFLELWAEPFDRASAQQSFSGNTFRVGLQDSANNSSTFEAIAQITSTTDNAFTGLTLNSGSIHEFVVRDEVLSFNVSDPDRRDLFNGTVDSFKFSISGQSVRMGRLVFDVTQNGLSTLDQVQLLRNGSLLTPGDVGSIGKVYLMWDAGAQSCFAHTQQTGAGTGMDCNGNPAASAKLILSFSQEEIISGTNDYKLRFNVTGVDVDDRVTIRLNDDDDSAKPVIAGSSNLNGEIYNGGAGNELFTNSSDFFREATSITDRNVIWSDRSADLHRYPTISSGNPPTISDNGSEDWTNGYLLKLNAEQAVTWIRD